MMLTTNAIQFLTTFFMLVGGHALADFGLQSEWLAMNKRRSKNPSNWYIMLSGHAFIHGVMVAVVLNSPLLGFFEVVAHFAIDFFKCEEKYDIKTDQALHLLCKVVWIACAVYGIR